MTRHARRAWLACLAVLALLLAGCTGVPRSSAPRTIAPVDVEAGTSSSPIVPAANADPRTIVTGFLNNSAIDSKNHVSARAFLATRTQQTWSDQSATIVDRVTIDVYKLVGQTATVPVRGRVIATLSAAGTYTRFSGTGKDVVFPFTLSHASGQWRIVGLRPGLLLTQLQFEDTYKLRPLYFFDLAHQYLVPDGRYSALSGDDLDTWLVNQVAAGARPELSNAVSSDVLPSHASARSISVTHSRDGKPTKIEIPGSSQLDPGGGRRLAAEIAKTVNAASPDEILQITDGGIPVSISGVGQTFTYQQLRPDFDGPPFPVSEVYYLRNGRIAGEDGRLLEGPLNKGTYFLNSIAMSRSNPRSELMAAGVTSQGLVVGDESLGFGRVVLGGALTSRPAWAPGISEVWVGKGSKIFRLAVDGKAAAASEVTVPSSTGGGQITALRISPEGSRIALVIKAGDGAQLFIGSIVRAAGQVRIDALQSISPESVTITDLGWVGELKIVAIGRVGQTVGEGQYYETNADGASWTAHALDGLSLPGPDSLTVARQQQAWVSVDKTVWVQVGGTWKPAGGTTDQTPGDKPVYLE